MKLRDLTDILQSPRGHIQWCIVYDWGNNKDIDNNCSIEYAVKNYGDRDVRRIYSCFENERDNLLIEVN